MGSGTLLYGYCAVCVGMLIFNIAFSLLLERRDRKTERVSRRSLARVDRQLERLHAGEAVERRHLIWLRRKLSRIADLIAFDRMMTERRGPDGGGELSAEMREYYRCIQPAILHLAAIYRDREDMQAAYFAWFLSRHKMDRHRELDAVQDILVDYMDRDSLYCRVNAFRALCSMGSPRHVARAAAVLDRDRRFFHSKLMTDSLLAFTGSHRELIALLRGQFGRFSPQTRLAVLNYIRFCSGDHCPWVLALMNDPEEDKELRLSAIRYFGRYVYPPAKPALLAFAADKDPMRWEYAAVSASALASYKDKDAVEALIGAIDSSNWHVRSNAAASLSAHGLEYGDLIAVVGGGDRYVREMMLYHLQLRRAGGERREGAV